MALSAEFGDVAVQPPLRLATYLEQRISEAHTSIMSLEDYVSSLEQNHNHPHAEEELITAKYWLGRETRELTSLKVADSKLSHGEPTLGQILLQKEIFNFNHYANQCAIKGANESARSILFDINALREIKH